jgi:hypothetical protein
VSVRENIIEFNWREQVKLLTAGPRNSKSNHFSKARHPYRIFLGVICSWHQCTECYVGLFTYTFSSLITGHRLTLPIGLLLIVQLTHCWLLTGVWFLAALIAKILGSFQWRLRSCFSTSLCWHHNWQSVCSMFQRNWHQCSKLVVEDSMVSWLCLGLWFQGEISLNVSYLWHTLTFKSRR